MRTFTCRFPALVVLGLCVCFAAGCGRPVGSVSGKVTFQGKPLKAGNVSFVSTEGGRSFAAGIEDGTYKVPNIMGGAYKVCIETASFKTNDAPMIAPGGVRPQTGPRGAKFEPPPGAPVGFSDPASMALAAAKKKYVAIPEKYAKPETTDLTYAFSGGSDTFDIDLK